MAVLFLYVDAIFGLNCVSCAVQRLARKLYLSHVGMWLANFVVQVEEGKLASEWTNHDVGVSAGVIA